MVILSHGNEGILYGYDSAYPAHKIWEPFTADRCTSLVGKPKLFFLQVSLMLLLLVLVLSYIPRLARAARWTMV